MQSFATLTDQAALNKQPVHLRLVRLPRAMTIEEFYRQYPRSRQELIAAINGVNAGETMPADDGETGSIGGNWALGTGH